MNDFHDNRTDLIDMCRQLSPLFIWAPTTRCGVTLIQRLISSSRQFIIYGENTYYTGRLPSAVHDVAATKEEGEKSRQRFLEGDYNFWSGSVLPDNAILLHSIMRAFYQITMAFEDSSRKDGFLRWGLKHPAVEVKRIQRIVQRLLPRAQHLFMYRHVEDVARSSKSRRWINSDEDVHALAANWSEGVTSLLEFSANNAQAMTVRYEELVAKPQVIMDGVAQFLAIDNYDIDIMNHRVNTFQGKSERGHSPSEYIQPSQLSERERELLYAAAEPGMKKMGYDRRA